MTVQQLSLKINFCVDMDRRTPSSSSSSNTRSEVERQRQVSDARMQANCEVRKINQDSYSKSCIADDKKRSS